MAMGFQSMILIPRLSVLIAIVLLPAVNGMAATTAIHFRPVCDLGLPDGLVTTDLLIDFEGQLFGQHLLLELTQGSVDTDPTDTFLGPPRQAFIDFFPTLAYSTFVTLGGPTEETSEDIIIVGASAELGGAALPGINANGINLAWAPAPGVVIEDRTRFMVARVTLSEDAAGTLSFFSNASGDGMIWRDLGFQDGRLGFLTPEETCDHVPEPTSATMAFFASLSLGATRRRFRSR